MIQSEFLALIVGILMVVVPYLLMNKNRVHKSFIKRKDNVATLEVVTFAREDAEKEGCLTEFNEFLFKKGSPVTNEKLRDSYVEALKTIDKFKV